MSLEIPSACACLPFCVSWPPRCMSARGPPHQWGAACLLLLRGIMWSVPIWSDRGQAGMGAGSQRPQAAVAWTPLPDCCMSAVIWLVRFFFGVRTERSHPEELWGRARLWTHLEMPALRSRGRERKGQGLMA